MKSKFANFIMSIIIILIIAVIGIFGIIIWEEIKKLDIAQEPEDFEMIASNKPKEEIDNKNIKTPNIVENELEKLPEINQNNENINYSQINVDKYFYNQLEEQSKIIYRALEVNKENMKTGNYKIELGDTFSSLLNTENGQEELGKYYQSAIEAYTYDNPNIFYLSPNKMYLNMQK